MGVILGGLARLLMVAGLIWLLTACEPEPTPFPVDMPRTPTATPLPGETPALRYLLLPNTAGLVPDVALLQTGAEVIQLTDPAAELPPYDIAVQYGVVPDWTTSELTPQVALVVNTAVPPFDTPEIASVVRRSLNPAEMVAALKIPGAAAKAVTAERNAVLRTELATIGLPDGVVIALGTTYVPGAEEVAAQLRAANIDAQLVPLTVTEARDALDAGRVQAALVMWSLDVEREGWAAQFGAENVINLYTTPISYQVAAGLTVSFTPGGFPLIAR